MRALKCAKKTKGVGTMGGDAELEEATSRLLGAIERIEETVAGQLDSAKSVDELKAQVELLIAEREQLFASLETERRRADRLESASDEVSARLGNVIDSVRAIMHTN